MKPSLRLTGTLISLVLCVSTPAFSEVDASSVPVDPVLIPATQGDIQQQDQSTLEALIPIAAALNGEQPPALQVNPPAQEPNPGIGASECPPEESLASANIPQQIDQPPSTGIALPPPRPTILTPEQIDILQSSTSAWEAMTRLGLDGVGPPKPTTIGAFVYPGGAIITPSGGNGSILCFEINGAAVFVGYLNGKALGIDIILPNGQVSSLNFLK